MGDGALGREASAAGYKIFDNVAYIRNWMSDWQQAMTAGAHKSGDNSFWLPEEQIGIRLVGGDRIAHTVLGADLSVDRTFDSIDVQMNMPNEPGTVNGLTQVGTDSQGREWLLRQGRLRPNVMSLIEISDIQFGNLTGLLPAFETPALGSAPARHWYSVCRLGPDHSAMRAETIEFVRQCNFARQRAAGSRSASLPAGNLAQALSLKGKLEPTGGYDIPPQDARIARRRHAEVVNALITELTDCGVYNRKVWSVDGYEVDLAVENGSSHILIEVKTSSFAQDVQTGTGQLMLYPKLMPDLAYHRRVLLLPLGGQLKLREAVEACDIEVHSYTYTDNAGGSPTIIFHSRFRELCGLP